MRLLVVEDEPDLLRGLTRALREDGYAVDGASDGREGLFKAKAWNYDAIVLDLMLPGLDGMSLLSQLRAEKVTPVLILTARDTVTERVAGLDSGADDYLAKPFELAELKARLRALIRRSAGEAGSVIEVNGVVMDVAAQKVTRDGRPVPLTSREFRLAELLILNRGKVVTRARIYEQLFDENHDSLSNIVDVYISRLRSALGKEFITTRRGEGYMVDV